ncbi:hypothetical protein LTR95_009801 [Oleoguttula sp. CCFEE 5521]
MRSYADRRQYHPAPLTQRPGRQSQQITLTPVSVSSAHSISSKLTVEGDVLSPVQYDTGVASPTPDSTDYLGSGSAGDEHLTGIMEVLAQLANWQLIEQTARIYLSNSSVPIAPVPLTLQIMSSIRNSKLVAAYRHNVRRTDEGRASQLHHAQEILRSSAREAVITSTTTVSELCAMYSLPRIEMIGHIFALAARGICYRLVRDEHKYEALGQDLFRCSKLAQRLAYDLTPRPTDAMIWLAHENLQTLTLIEGDASLGVWRRLGDIANEVLALGFHREATHAASSTPFFLAEIRRRVFSSVYQYDKAYAILFDRPPRIASRYADCKAPLDLSDEQVLADTPEALELIKTYVTEEGWNVREGFRSTTWARIRYSLGAFREELIEHYLGSGPAPTDEVLEELSIRCCASRRSLPAYLQYSRELWKSDLPGRDIFMLASIHLSYMKVELYIRRLMNRNDPKNIPCFWVVSARMLDNVILMGSIRDKDDCLSRDLPAIMYNYGLPCAATVAQALHETSKTPSLHQLPGELDRASLIRNLSVFLSDLESVCGPGSLNHEYCTQAAKAISATLDSVLNGTVASDDFAAALTPATPDVGSYATPTSALPALANDKLSGGVTGLNDLATFDFTNFDFLSADLTNWNPDMDMSWTSTNGDWSL